jgi:hypothetical protein
MLTKYIEAAMRHVEYEIIEDDPRSMAIFPAFAAYGRTPRRLKDAAKNARARSKIGY